MDELAQLKLLAGITNRPLMQEYKLGTPESNMSYTGTEKAKLMKKNKIDNELSI